MESYFPEADNLEKEKTRDRVSYIIRQIIIRELNIDLIIFYK